jgi:hypothetical protein
LSGLYWYSLSASSNGQELFAAVAGGDIYTSSDYGVTWTNVTANTALSGLYWGSLASSADGHYVAALADFNSIYEGFEPYASITNSPNPTIVSSTLSAPDTGYGQAPTSNVGAKMLAIGAIVCVANGVYLLHRRKSTQL